MIGTHKHLTQELDTELLGWHCQVLGGEEILCFGLA